MRLLRRLPLLLLALCLAGCGLTREVDRDPAAIPDGPLEALGADATGPVIELGRGRSLGIGWRYSIYESVDGWCTQLELVSFTSSGCGAIPGEEGAFGGIGSGGSSGGPTPLEGIVSPEVAEVWIQTSSSEQIETRLLSLAAAGLDGKSFVGFAPENVVVTSVVAVDADGQVLETLDLP